jgi:hypothetical protein
MNTVQNVLHKMLDNNIVMINISYRTILRFVQKLFHLKV